jgi:hypothetical protein
MCQKEGFKFWLDIKNNGDFLLDLACPKCLSVILATQFTTRKQLKD